MQVRRLTIALCVLLVLAVIGGAIAEREDRRDDATAPPVTLPTGPPKPVITGTLPADRVVRAHVGDAVTVDVVTAEPDDASVDALGLTAPTAPGVPGQLAFVATAPGRYPVLLDSGATAGTIVIAAAAAR